MKKELIIGRGKEAQQSQTLDDPTVSRKHLSLSLSSRGNTKPYHIRLLNYDNVIYVNDELLNSPEGYIDIGDKVQLGKNKVELDVKKAIEDLNNLGDISEMPTQIPNSVNEEKIHSNHSMYSVIGNEYHREWDKYASLLFSVANVLIIVLLLLAVMFKAYPIIHTVLLLLLVGAILVDIILYTKKKNNDGR